MSIDYRQHTVLITGASAGIGEAFAREFAKRGSNLVLVARRSDRLEQLAAELRMNHSVTVVAVVLDLASPHVADELRTELTARRVTVTALVNNAGFGTYGEFIHRDSERLRRELAVDVVAPVMISQILLPDLLKSDGFLINVASLAAYTPTPQMAVYGAAKAFVLSFTESLWAELRSSNVTVFALSPGATDTEFNSVIGTDAAAAGVTPRTTDDVIRTALRHLDGHRPGPSVIDGRLNRLRARLPRVLSRRATVTLVRRMTVPGR